MTRIYANKTDCMVHHFVAPYRHELTLCSSFAPIRAIRG